MLQPHTAAGGLTSRNHWTTRIFTLANPGHAAISAGLVEHCYALEAASTASSVAPGAKSNLFESRFNFFQHERAEVRQLRDFCLGAVHQAAAAANAGLWEPDARVQVMMAESWCHVTRDGGYHDVHAHPMCSWCGIYYVEPGEADAASRNGVNRFYEPRGNVNAYSDYGTRYLNAEGSVDFAVTEGLLVVFPSYLRHAALPYRGASDRIVIAFNARVLKAEGT